MECRDASWNRDQDIRREKPNSDHSEKE